MEIRCSCGKAYNLDPAKVSAAGGRFICKACFATVVIPPQFDDVDIIEAAVFPSPVPPSSPPTIQQEGMVDSSPTSQQELTSLVPSPLEATQDSDEELQANFVVCNWGGFDIVSQSPDESGAESFEYQAESGTWKCGWCQSFNNEGNISCQNCGTARRVIAEPGMETARINRDISWTGVLVFSFILTTIILLVSYFVAGKHYP